MFFFSCHISIISNLYLISQNFSFYHFKNNVWKPKYPREKMTFFSSFFFSLFPPQMSDNWPVTSLPDCSQGNIKTAIFVRKWQKETLQKRVSKSDKNSLVHGNFSEWELFKWQFFPEYSHCINFTLSSLMVQVLRLTAVVWPGSFTSVNPLVSAEADLKNSLLCRRAGKVQLLKNIWAIELYK